MPIVPKRGAIELAIVRPEIQPRQRVRRAANDADPRVVSSIPEKPSGEPGTERKDYDVGYKKPPRHTRFPPGRSGNPRGRPKGAKGLKTIMRELLTAKMTVRTAEGVKRMSRIEAMAHKLIEAAFNGNLRALQAMLNLYQAAVSDDPPPGSADGGRSPPLIDVDEHDHAILAALRLELLEQTGGEA